MDVIIEMYKEFPKEEFELMCRTMILTLIELDFCKYGDTDLVDIVPIWSELKLGWNSLRKIFEELQNERYKFAEKCRPSEEELEKIFRQICKMSINLADNFPIGKRYEYVKVIRIEDWGGMPL